MRNPSLAADLVKAVKEGTNKPVSVKFRLGYTADEMNFVGIWPANARSRSRIYNTSRRTRLTVLCRKARLGKKSAC